MKSLNSQKYYVREDATNARPTKIHNESCGYVVTNLQKDSATVMWHGPYSLNDAINFAEKISKKYTTGWEKSNCCCEKN